MPRAPGAVGPLPRQHQLRVGGACVQIGSNEGKRDVVAWDSGYWTIKRVTLEAQKSFVLTSRKLCEQLKGRDCPLLKCNSPLFFFNYPSCSCYGRPPPSQDMVRLVAQTASGPLRKHTHTHTKKKRQASKQTSNQAGTLTLYT